MMTENKIDYNEIQPINEIYIAPFQGEGKYMGIPHIVIRTSGCPLRCQWKDSFCDTPYSSWQPEKGRYTLNDVVSFFSVNMHISHTMITGGSPTLHEKLLQELCKIGKKFNQFITLETEGSKFVKAELDYISLSIKLSNSTPIPGTINTYTNQNVTLKEKENHEKHRLNYQVLHTFLRYYRDKVYLKEVISSQKDLDEVKLIQTNLGLVNDRVYLMPEGVTEEQLREKRLWIAEICKKEGYRYSDRLQIITFGSKRGV